MSINVRPEIMQRLVLAKALLRAGQKACSDTRDKIAFARGIMSLHDAAETALATVADHIHAPAPKNTSFMDYVKLIEGADASGSRMSFQTQLRHLNTLRVNAKHHGIIPETESSRSFPATIEDFLDELCATYVGIPLAKVSLIATIADDNVRSALEEAELLCDAGRFGKSLEYLAVAMYHICDHQAVNFSRDGSGVFRRDNSPFPDYAGQSHTLLLVSRGIDVYLYHRFKNLTPEISYVDGKQCIRHDKLYWHDANWDEANARFALEFCVDTATKFQRSFNEGPRLASYVDLYEDVIEPVGEQATIHVHVHRQGIPDMDRLVLHKGETFVGYADGDPAEMITVNLYGPALNALSDPPRPTVGWVRTEEVVIRRRQRQPDQ